jgi:hypothetical protein
MIKEFNDIKYEIPELSLERFDYVTRKLKHAKEGNHIELFRAYTVIFNNEFNKYKEM